MTRRDFVALAEALKAAQPDRGNAYAPRSVQTKGQGAHEAWRECVRAVADACQGQNPRFDRERFYSACGYEG